MRGDKEKILSSGFSEYLPKPIDLKQLEKFLKEYVKE
jgi:CheY-like chemotaxis protein